MFSNLSSRDRRARCTLLVLIVVPATVLTYLGNPDHPLRALGAFIFGFGVAWEIFRTDDRRLARRRPPNDHGAA